MASNIKVNISVLLRRKGITDISFDLKLNTFLESVKETDSEYIFNSMSKKISKIDKYLGVYKHATKFDSGYGLKMPEAYKKFWYELKSRPTAVHYIPEEGRWKKNEVTGELIPVQNIPIKLSYPKEFHFGLWGGEAVVKGFQKRHFKKRRVPKFWIPVLKRSVVRSDIMNVYLSVVVTDRTIKLIHDNYGFDHYLLKTLACDLRSTLALKLKQKMLMALQDGCPAYKDDPEKQQLVLNEYKKYLSAYTPEEIEWYGLTWKEAVNKLSRKEKEENKPVPLKQIYRVQLIEQLKAAGMESSEKKVSETSWISKINPFAKKRET